MTLFRPLLILLTTISVSTVARAEVICNLPRTVDAYVNLLPAPDATGFPGRRLPENTQVVVQSRAPGSGDSRWVEIVVQDARGWVPEQYVCPRPR